MNRLVGRNIHFDSLDLVAIIIRIQTRETVLKQTSTILLEPTRN